MIDTLSGIAAVLVVGTASANRSKKVLAGSSRVSAKRLRRWYPTVKSGNVGMRTVPVRHFMQMALPVTFAVGSLSMNKQISTTDASHVPDNRVVISKGWD